MLSNRPGRAALRITAVAGLAVGVLAAVAPSAAGASTVRTPVSTAVATAAPTVPTNLRITNLRPTSVTFQWDLSQGTGLISYAIYQNGVFRGFTYWGSPVGLAGNLTPGTTYTFTVQAVSQNGVGSGFSAPLVVTTLA